MNLIQEVRQFLKDNRIDYLLVNSTNEFLVEYADLMENSRYFLTKFSGSTGDALISQKDIFLFVDGRYYEQADLEIDKNSTTVVKMKLGESLPHLLTKKIKPNKTLAMVAKKNSQGRYEILKSALDKKNVEIRLLNSDPVIDFVNKPFEKDHKIEQIGTKITGLCADEKLHFVSQGLNKNEALLVTNLEEISYLCNLRDFSREYSSKIEAKCLVKKDFAVLFSSGFIKNVGDNFEVLRLEDFEKYVENLKDTDTFFVDKTSINAHDYALLGEKSAFLKENKLKTMKSVKTKAEIEHYKKCFEKTDKVLTATRKFIEENDHISEYDIEQNLRANFLNFGAKSLSFKSIVAKDKNSALAHYSKSSKTEILQDGSFILIDCGAYYEGGYATDCTRVFVKGTPTVLQKKVYTVVLKGFLKAFNKKITPNTTGFALDNAARKVLNNHKPAGFEFSHSLGHGIGIGVHENPPSLAFSPTAKTPLKPNMCFTIEPGLYKKTFGGVRLENSCYLSEENGKLIIKSFSNMCFEEKLIDFKLLTPTEKKQLKSFEVK